MSHVHVKINFSYGIDSWNRCLSVHKRLQIRAQSSFVDIPVPLVDGEDGISVDVGALELILLTIDSLS
jgi:hypothetical protein